MNQLISQISGQLNTQLIEKVSVEEAVIKALLEEFGEGRNSKDAVSILEKLGEIIAYVDDARSIIFEALKQV